MNKQNAHLYLPLVQALADGKTVQVYNEDRPTLWQDSIDVNFGLTPQSYRIKPTSFPPIPENCVWHNPDNLTAEQVGDGWRLILPSELSKLDLDAINIHKWDPSDGRWDDTSWGGNFSGYTYRVPISTPFPCGSYLKDGQLVKPWSLSRHIPGFRPLRDGEEWSGRNWTAEKLADGFRPVLNGEIYQAGVDEIFFGGEFEPLNHGGRIHDKASESDFIRTRRPLPEPTKRVPLGLSDVPPGSAIRNGPNDRSWVLVTGISDEEVFFDVNESETYRGLMNKQILRPGQTDWQPCYHEVQP